MFTNLNKQTLDEIVQTNESIIFALPLLLRSYDDDHIYNVWSLLDCITHIRSFAKTNNNN